MENNHVVQLNSINGLPQAVVRQFESKGIMTANQVVEIAAMREGILLLNQELAGLNLLAQTFEFCMARIRDALDTEALEAASHPVDVSNFGLGARLESPE